MQQQTCIDMAPDHTHRKTRNICNNKPEQIWLQATPTGKHVTFATTNLYRYGIRPHPQESTYCGQDDPLSVTRFGLTTKDKVALSNIELRAVRGSVHCFGLFCEPGHRIEAKIKLLR